MRLIPLDEVEAGMVLARDVENSNGYRILGKDTVITESQIALLEGWGVLDVLIKDGPAPSEEESAPESQGSGGHLEARREKLKKSFEGVLVNEWMNALYAEAENRLDVKRFW